MKIKILHWNKWFNEDIKQITPFLKSIDADIYCLQELNSSSEVGEIELLEKESVCTSVVGRTDTDHGEQCQVLT